MALGHPSWGLPPQPNAAQRPHRFGGPKFLFGRGDGTSGAHIYHRNPANANVPFMGFQPIVSFFGDALQLFSIDPIRGFRYGISNIGDKFSSCTFRRDHYGHLRDMIEMRKNTAYFNQQTQEVDYPIEAQFFADDGSIAAPDATSCSNLSTNLTSSAPFFDRDVVDFENSFVIRNRGPLNNKVVDITIEI